MSAAPDLGALFNSIVNAIVTVIQELANALAANASLIATVVFLGVVTYVVVRYGAGLFRRIIGVFRGLLP
ncbi:MAG: hypothetical protein QXY09_05965 [Acidilobaceae archaeon]